MHLQHAELALHEQDAGLGAAFYVKKREPAQYEQAGRLINEGR